MRICLTDRGGRNRLFLIPALLLVLGACSDPEIRVAPVQLSGQIVVPVGIAADTTVHVNVYHAWALEGDLRHPVEFIDSFETSPGKYAHEFDYPIDKGEGLLVYAWLDVDGDGVLCTPASRLDPAGLTEVAEFAPGAVAVDVEVTVPCAGPDWFYPPAGPDGVSGD